MLRSVVAALAADTVALCPQRTGPPAAAILVSVHDVPERAVPAGVLGRRVE